MSYKNFKEINKAQIHIIMIDSMRAFRTNDLDIIRKSIKEGRGTILIVNKWDLIDEKYH